MRYKGESPAKRDGEETFLVNWPAFLDAVSNALISGDVSCTLKLLDGLQRRCR